jgi:uncharacterized protein (TIGR00290 family)
MTIKKNVLLFWSGGKNSALTLTALRKNTDYNILGLVTLIDRETNCVRYHGISEALIVDQSKLLGIPMVRIFQDRINDSNTLLNEIVIKLSPFKNKNLFGIAFGDVRNLDDKNIHEKIARELKVESLFPLWNISNEKLITDFFENNHQALISAIDKNLIDLSFLAKEYNREWISKLPETIDSFGENHEFHTFATYSPYFKMRIPYSKAIAIDDNNYTISLMKEP